ncbi:hypothetical protein BpHYR1_018794 [Brachionus plicatilis]|uniref:Uncharacterized protein n=1 Tax=Brachionus plicatilis TaxID=10195 RepID=A0A3M7PIC0_BRAPC|nr:hypothetical protein BpHYR1_018794 [Brachionus plicatilis]
MPKHLLQNFAELIRLEKEEEEGNKLMKQNYFKINHFDVNLIMNHYRLNMSSRQIFFVQNFIKFIYLTLRQIRALLVLHCDGFWTEADSIITPVERKRERKVYNRPNAIKPATSIFDLDITDYIVLH